MNVAKKFLIGLALSSALASGALADELVGLAPFSGSSFGQQSDGNSAPYTQGFTAPANSILEAIRWWGFHTLDSGGSIYDNFVVSLDGAVQSGVLSIVSGTDFDEYTLDIADAALTASSLTIVNDSFDVEWFWQSTSAVGNPASPDATAVAFSLIGSRSAGQSVPEPTSLLLMLAAMAALAVGRSRTSRSIRPSRK